MLLHFSLNYGINRTSFTKKVTRARRTPEQKIAEIDAQIAKLEAKKAEIMRPIKMKEVMEKASSMSPEEIAEKLGIEL